MSAFPALSQCGGTPYKTRQHAAKLAKWSKALSTILPKKSRLHNIVDEPGFATPLSLNPDFSRLTDNKTISKKRMGSVSFFKLGAFGGLFKIRIGV